MKTVIPKVTEGKLGSNTEGRESQQAKLVSGNMLART